MAIEGIGPLGAAGLEPLAVAAPDFQRLKKSAGAEEREEGFADVLAQAVSEVNQLQFNASEQSVALAAGDVADVSQVVVAAEKAELSLQLAIQVRNKLLEAYQEIMRMPL